MEFWEISGREEDEKRGFLGAVGLLPRCVEWVTGIQKDRERIQTDRQTVAPLLHLQKKSEAGRLADALCGMSQLRVC